MKKYFKENIFYQGDGKVILPLFLVYIIAFIVNYLKVNEYFRYTIVNRLYRDYIVLNIVDGLDVFCLALYLGVIYIITSGLFKRKKWTTFLSMPYSKLDIRKREFFILFISFIIYISIFLLMVLKGCIQYYEILSYLDKFYRIIIIETLRLVSVGLLILAIICIVDTIFSNIYYIVGGVLISLIYFIFFISNFEYILREQIVYKLNFIDLLNIIYDYILGSMREFRLYEVLIIATVFLFISIVLIYISKRLTNKMMVENMNEGILFSFPKKISNFVLLTLPGLIIALFSSEFIYEYNDYNYNYYMLCMIRLIIVVVISFVVKYIIKNIKKESENKNKIYY